MVCSIPKIRSILRLWSLGVVFLLCKVQPIFSQTEFQFPKEIEFCIFKNNIKTSERSVFSFADKGRYIDTAYTLFRFIDQKHNTTNEIHTYLNSLDYSYISSIFLCNLKKYLETQVIHGKGFDQSETMMIKFQTDTQKGFEPLCDALLFIDLNTALVILAQATYLNTHFNEQCYYYSFTDKKIKYAQVKKTGKKSLSIKGKKMLCNMFQIHSLHDEEKIDIYINNDLKGYSMPASILWKNLHIQFKLNNVIY